LSSAIAWPSITHKIDSARMPDWPGGRARAWPGIKHQPQNRQHVHTKG
jgi:hypothetical protein